MSEQRFKLVFNGEQGATQTERVTVNGSDNLSLGTIGDGDEGAFAAWMSDNPNGWLVFRNKGPVAISQTQNNDDAGIATGRILLPVRSIVQLIKDEGDS